jgi:hypothetical protein
MKKVFSFLVVLLLITAMVISVVGCNKNSTYTIIVEESRSENESTTEVVQEVTTEEVTTEEPTQEATTEPATTEPVTTPRTPNGKIIFAVILGIITTLIRLSTGYDGVGLSILLCCLITPFIDKFACVNRGPIISSKMVISYSILTIILLALASFVVYLTTNMGLLFNIF